MIPAVVAGAIALGASMLIPHAARTITHALNKAGVAGEDVKKATERIEKSDRVKKAIHEAAAKLNKIVPGVDLPVVGRVTLADIPVIGLAAEKALVDSGVAKKVVEQTFKKYGIKADSSLVKVATAEAIRDRAAANLGSFVAEVGAATAATARISSLAKKVVSEAGEGAVKKGIINIADKQARKKLVGLITREAAIAGAAEGAANVGVYKGAYEPESMRGKEGLIKTLGDVGIGAAQGAIMAGVAGYALGTALTSKKLVATPKDTPTTKGIKKIGRTLVDWSQELVDVQEKFGDIVADRIVGGPTIRVGIITPSPSPSTSTSATGTISSPANTTTQATSPNPATTSSTTSSTSSTSSISTTSSSTSSVFTPTPNPDPDPTFNPTNSDTETETNTETDTDTETNTNTNTNTNTDQDTITPTPTPTPTPIPVPSVTPSPNYLPMPLVPPYKEAPVLLGVSGRKIYVNELARLKKLLRDMLNW